jgi:hypothetical protein
MVAMSGEQVAELVLATQALAGIVEVLQRG